MALWFAPSAGAVTLVNQAGVPVGGQYQAWADESLVPTIPGSLIVEFTGPMPGCPIACSQGPGMGIIDPDGSVWIQPRADGPAITWLTPGVADRWALMWELGHQFDWAVLTNADRQRFAELWSSTSPWWDTLASVEAGSEDGLEATFANDYADCALGLTPDGTMWVHSGAEPADPASVCNLIDELAQRAAQPPTITEECKCNPSSMQSAHGSRRSVRKSRGSKRRGRRSPGVGVLFGRG